MSPRAMMSMAFFALVLLVVVGLVTSQMTETFDYDNPRELADRRQGLEVVIRQRGKPWEYSVILAESSRDSPACVAWQTSSSVRLYGLHFADVDTWAGYGRYIDSNGHFQQAVFRKATFPELNNYQMRHITQQRSGVVAMRFMPSPTEDVRIKMWRQDVRGGASCGDRGRIPLKTARTERLTATDVILDLVGLGSFSD